jgi:hypothetical protein
MAWIKVVERQAAGFAVVSLFKMQHSGNKGT